MNFNEWQVPKYEITELNSKASKYCVCIPVINEGEKIRKQLDKISKLANIVDVIILDGGSTDGSLEIDFLKKSKVRVLLTKKDSGKLSAQLRMGFSYALSQGYEGIITVDGNNKDSVESIPSFVQKLEEGYDFVQGSRYVPGGLEINTPLSRKLAIKLIHAPVISFISRFKYTDTTNGFRAHSRAFFDGSPTAAFQKYLSNVRAAGLLIRKGTKVRIQSERNPCNKTIS